MLHLPKNDRILFTFFGISLVSKRRSRATEVRSIVSTKNKLYRAVGERGRLYKPVLIRDLNDVHYPYENEYKDFKKRPRWKEFMVFEHHPLGLSVHAHEYFACLDRNNKEWDFTKEADLVNRQVESDDERKSRNENRELVEDVWDFLPQNNQAHLIIYGLLRYSDIAVIDDKGDVLYDFPHLYVDFNTGRRPFVGYINILQIGEKEISLSEEYKQIKVFPDKFKKARPGKIHKDKNITLSAETLAVFEKYGRISVLYETDGRYSFLKPRDIIRIAGASDESFIQITHKFKAKIRDYLEKSEDDFRIRIDIEQQLGRKFDEDEEINIYEFKRIYKRQFEKDLIV
jgi:hypothetical protein